MIAFTDNDAVICCVPSKTNGGMYLVKVYEHNQTLQVEHQCPAHQYKAACSHVEQAASFWKELHPWDFYPWMPVKQIVCTRKHILLQPHWKQLRGKEAGNHVTEYC